MGKSINSFFQTLIFETDLLSFSGLTSSERDFLKRILSKSNNEDLDSESENKFSKIFTKILHSTKTHTIRSSRLNQLQEENRRISASLSKLHNKYGKQISFEDQISLFANIDEISLDQIKFTPRALKALNKLSINTVGDLSRISKERLKTLNNLGTKTLSEIIDRAFEYGIQIK